ncbi:MAG: hypothetical protein ABSB75_02170, partial [Candidatus Limnocylindrales bacterium]
LRSSEPSPAVAAERLVEPVPAPDAPIAPEPFAEPAYSSAVAESVGLTAESEPTDQLPLF